MNKEIYSFWISGELSLLNHLCVRSIQEQGHKLILYSFDEIATLYSECEVRDANEIFSKEEIFFYENMEENFKFGGIAERLKAEMLYKFGGVHVDLDVVFLKPFDLEAEYVLKPHKNGIVGNIIKAPKESLLADYYRKWTRHIKKDAKSDEFERSFLGLSIAADFLDLTKFVVEPGILGMDENKYYMPLLENGGMIPSPERMAIHFCGAYKHYENYAPDSFYERLLKKYNLI